MVKSYFWTKKSYKEIINLYIQTITTEFKTHSDSIYSIKKRLIANNSIYWYKVFPYLAGTTKMSIFFFFISILLYFFISFHSIFIKDICRFAVFFLHGQPGLHTYQIAYIQVIIYTLKKKKEIKNTRNIIQLTTYMTTRRDKNVVLQYYHYCIWKKTWIK